MAIVNPQTEAPRPEAGAAAKRKRKSFWLWRSFKDDLQNFGQRVGHFGAWWREWRGSASFRTLLAFIVLYSVMAALRTPSEAVIEQSRHAEEMSFIQDFLKSYCVAGGTVLAERPHGGTELYPRGVLLQGEILDAFNRAPVGGIIVAHVRPPAWNPLSGFYGFPPVYAGGGYFHLERKLNLSLYRCSYLIRKDKAESGTMLLVRVDLAI